jgi:hypothetical protein
MRDKSRRDGCTWELAPGVNRPYGTRIISSDEPGVVTPGYCQDNCSELGAWQLFDA